MADNGHKRKDKVKEKQKMGIFDRFKVLTVNDAINESRTDKNAVLIDIRAKDVYKRKHQYSNDAVRTDRKTCSG